MKIQEVMMKQLGCLSSEQVTEDYPTMSLYKALTEYFIAFRVKCSGMDTLCLRLSPSQSKQFLSRVDERLHYLVGCNN